MNEVEKEYMSKLKLEMNKLKQNNDFLILQQREFKKLAEVAGSEVAQWKHECIRKEEIIKKLESELKTYKR